MLNKLTINKADYFIWLYILYQLQDIVYPAGRLNQILGVLFLFFSLILGGKYLLIDKYRPALLNITSLLIWMYIIYGTIFIFSSSLLDLEFNRYYYLQGFLLSLMPILAVYDLYNRQYLNKQKILIYLIPLFILCILHFIKNHNDIISRFEELGASIEEATNNVGYEFLCLFPLILLIRNKFYRYILLLVAIGFIISSFKRGAIIICIICFIYIALFELFNSKNTNKLFTFILLFIISVIGYKYTVDLHSNSVYFQQRVEATEEGSMSHREVLWEDITESYLSGNPLQLLIGRGANSTLEATDNYAHNDWLETLHNNGFFGALILLSFYLAILITTNKIKHQISNEELLSYRVLFIICFIRTFFSMSILDMTLGLDLVIAYLIYRRETSSATFNDETPIKDMKDINLENNHKIINNDF